MDRTRPSARPRRDGGPDRAAGERTAALRLRAWAAVDAVVARGAGRYRREKDLPRLLPRLAADAALDGKAPAAIVAHLKQALLRERTLGQRGHRSYNLVRHMALAQALKAETDRQSVEPGPEVQPSGAP